MDSAEIKTLLARQLAPSGKTASLAALLKHGGLRASFKLPEAGTLVVKWYLAPLGAKPKLLAVGQAKFAAGKTSQVNIKLTALGKKLLKHARKIQLEATGAFTPRGQATVRVTRRLALER